MLSGISGSSGGMSSIIAQMQAKMFAKGDADSSGGIDVKEFGSMVENSPMGKAGISSADQVNQFKKMDVDGNGSLTQSELETGMKDMMSQFQSTMQAFGSGGKAGGRSGADDNTLKTLLDMIGKSSETSSKKTKNVNAGEDGNGSVQKMLEQLTAKINSAYGAESKTKQLSLQA